MPLIAHISYRHLFPQDPLGLIQGGPASGSREGTSEGRSQSVQGELETGPGRGNTFSVRAELVCGWGTGAREGLMLLPVQVTGYVCIHICLSNVSHSVPSCVPDLLCYESLSLPGSP